MENNLDLLTVGNDGFQNAITVHPVTSAELMYRLHKQFSEIELQRTYEEIEKLQVSKYDVIYKCTHNMYVLILV